jgi:hypothetical protein
MPKVNADLSQKLFQINTQDELEEWLEDAMKSLGGVSWRSLGGLENNVHTVEVASDPALALVERPTNSIDALLDLKALELSETAPSPHLAAEKWWGVPKGGLAGASTKDLTRLNLADLIQVTMHESNDGSRPTISIQDQGTGQHPDDFPKTLLSLHESNKKGSTHLMGVYGAGGSASYRFARSTIVVSRLSPSLLEGRPDEIGMTIVRYNPLDPEKFKTGRYEYLATKSGEIPRMDLAELPELPYGTYVKLIEYQIQKYSGPAYAPQRSLYQLLHAALPDPALPLRIVERRAKRYAGVKGEQERRQVAGLLYLLNREGTCVYSEERKIPVEPGMGSVTLRYFVLAGKENPYTTADQGLTISLNGQRQIIKDRTWLKRQLELFFLFRRLIVVVDGTQLSSEAKREMFSSTRETGVDTPLTKKVLDLVIQEIEDDEDLYALEETAKQEALAGATETTTAKVKKQLASEIGAYLKGAMTGKAGGKKKKRRKKRKGKPWVRNTDDSAMLEIPDKLTILNDPIRIEQGQTNALRLEINAKNDFLPKYESGLSVVIGQELKDHITVRSKGRLLGGRVRLTLEAAEDAPITKSTAKVVLVVPELGVVLSDQKEIEISKPKEDDERDDRKSGGDLDIKVNWIKRDKWVDLGEEWDEKMVGMCEVHREDPKEPTAITRAEWTLNEDFDPFQQVIETRKLSATALENFRDAYTYPVALGLFHQRLALDEKETKADEEGESVDIPADYQKSEQLRLASAVLMALQPDVQLAEMMED